MRGQYRILLGMAAGVGKTYRMLQEGRQAQGDGRDVVIGYLEPHDRPETAALAEGLEQVPRLRAEHGGLELEEMDVDAVIRRAPELALVDELAHTNATVMRNEKRYQDIEEILDAGIDVISTVNVQHLESLNDAIFELTEIRVRETFPDRILDEADQVVLVDLTPEELQERLRAGKVYSKERAEVALQNFFRHENLATLRELVLREVAEDVEARRHLQPLGALSQQAVAERVLVLDRAAAEVATDPPPRVAVGAAARRAKSTRSGCALRARADTPRKRPSSRRCAASRACSASTSSKRRATTWSPSCATSPPSAARLTCSSALPTRSAAARSSAARSSRAWSARSPESTSASSQPPIGRTRNMTSSSPSSPRSSFCSGRCSCTAAASRGARVPPAAAVLVPFTGGELEPPSSTRRSGRAG